LPPVRPAAQERGTASGGARFCSTPLSVTAGNGGWRLALGMNRPALRCGGDVRRCGIGGAAAATGYEHPWWRCIRLFTQRCRARAAERAPQRRDGRTLQGGHVAAGPDRVRVAGGAELGGHIGRQAGRFDPDAVQGAARLVSRVRQARSRVCRNGKVPGRCCPMARPLVGASGIPGLWLNLGHGSSGWALSLRIFTGTGRHGAGQSAGARHGRVCTLAAFAKTDAGKASKSPERSLTQ
jgi:hypothetical protein